MAGHCSRDVRVPHCAGGRQAPREVRTCPTAGRRRHAVDPDRPRQIVRPAVLRRCCSAMSGSRPVVSMIGPGSAPAMLAARALPWAAAGRARPPGRRAAARGVRRPLSAAGRRRSSLTPASRAAGQESAWQRPADGWVTYLGGRPQWSVHSREPRRPMTWRPSDLRPDRDSNAGPTA